MKLADKAQKCSTKIQRRLISVDVPYVDSSYRDSSDIFVRKHSSGALFQISGFMDRENPRLSDLQIGFIKGLVMIRVKSFHNFPYPDFDRPQCGLRTRFDAS